MHLYISTLSPILYLDFFYSKVRVQVFPHKSTKLLTRALPLKETNLGEHPSPQSSHVSPLIGNKFVPRRKMVLPDLCKRRARAVKGKWSCGVITILVWYWEPTTVTIGLCVYLLINQFMYEPTRICGTETESCNSCQASTKQKLKSWSKQINLSYNRQ